MSVIRHSIATLNSPFLPNSHSYSLATSIQMPYMVISGGFNCETKVGGKHADPQLMAELVAKKGNITQMYTTQWTAQETLNRLEMKGWRVISSCALPTGEIAWTLQKDVNGATMGQKFG